MADKKKSALAFKGRAAEDLNALHEVTLSEQDWTEVLIVLQARKIIAERETSNQAALASAQLLLRIIDSIWEQLPDEP